MSRSPHWRFETAVLLVAVVTLGVEMRDEPERPVGSTNVAVDAASDLPPIVDAIRGYHRTSPAFTVTPHSLLYAQAPPGERSAIWERDLATGRVRLIAKDSRHDFKQPVRLGDRVLALFDTGGDQKWRVVGTSNPELLEMPHIHELTTIDGSRGALIGGRRRNRAAVFELTADGDIRVLARVALEGTVRDVAAAGRDRLVFATTRGVVTLRLASGELRASCPGFCDEVRSVAVDRSRNRLLLATRMRSEFVQIAEASMRSPEAGPRAVLLRTPRDKYALQLVDDTLYFIENVETRRLLSALDLDTGQTRRLSTEGVVYRYHVTEVGQIHATWAGLQTPRTLVAVPAGSSLEDVVPRNTQLELPSPDWVSLEGHGPAWVFRPEKQPRGAVLVVHGGPRIDVSPRWDPAIQLWLELGFAVVAPNYPGSLGFGATPEKRSGERERLECLSAWHDWIRRQWPGVPRIAYGLSYGAQLAQRLAIRGERFSGLVLHSPLRLLPGVHEVDHPRLYLLGENDALANQRAHLRELRANAGMRVRHCYYRGTGHLIRRSNVLSHALATMTAFVRGVLASS